MSRVRLNYPSKLIVTGQFKLALLNVSKLTKEVASARITLVLAATEESTGGIEYVNFN